MELPIENVVVGTAILASGSDRVVAKFPHDTEAFTQGLFFRDGYFYEGTGLKGRSTLRRVELETGRVLASRALGSEFFGEGIALFGGDLVQLTWQSKVAFVYDFGTFEPKGRFSYETEGWGLASDGAQWIMSDGTSSLYFRDASSFAVTRRLPVTDADGRPVSLLNELEYVEGMVYANVWKSDQIFVIDPTSGQVREVLDLAGLLSPAEESAADVLNGIAYDPESGRVFVTGKLWPYVFEIRR